MIKVGQIYLSKKKTYQWLLLLYHLKKYMYIGVYMGFMVTQE